MEKLRRYLRTLPPDKVSRNAFASAVGTTMNYIRGAMSKKKKFGIDLCMRIEDASDGAVKVEDLRPDTDLDAFYERRQERKRRAEEACLESA